MSKIKPWRRGFFNLMGWAFYFSSSISVSFDSMPHKAYQSIQKKISLSLSESPNVTKREITRD